MWHWLVVTFASFADWTTQTFRETTSGLQRFGGWAVNTTLFIPNHLQPGFGNDDYADIIYWTNADYCEHFQIDCGPRLKQVTHVTVSILDDLDIPITKAAKLPSSTSFSDAALASRYPFHPRPTTAPAPSLSFNIPSVTTTLTQDAFSGSKLPHPFPANHPALSSLPRCTSSVVESNDVPTSFSQPSLKETHFLPPPFLVFSTTTSAIAITATASLLFCFLSTILWLYRYARAADAATAESLNRANEAEAENERLRALLELTAQETDHQTKRADTAGTERDALRLQLAEQEDMALQQTQRADTAETERDALRLQLAEKEDMALQQTIRADVADRQRKSTQFRAVQNFRAFRIASICLSWFHEQRINNDATISRLRFQQRVDQSDINIKKTALESKQRRIESQDASISEKDALIDELESSNNSKDKELSQWKSDQVASGVREKARDATITRQKAENERLQRDKQEAETKLEEKVVELKQANSTIDDMRQAVLSATKETKTCTQGTQTKDSSPAESPTPPSNSRFAQSAQDADEAGLFIEEDARVIFSLPQSRGHAQPANASEQIAWSTVPIAVLRSTAVPSSRNDAATVLGVDFGRVQRGIRHLEFCRTLGGKNDGISLATILSTVPNPYLFTMPDIEASEAAAVPLGTDAQCLKPFESLQLSKTMGFTVLPNERTACKKTRPRRDANKAKGRKDGASSISTSLVSSPSPSHASLASPKPKHDLFKSKWAS